MFRHNHFILKGTKWRKSENDTDDLIISYMYTIYLYSSWVDTSIFAPIHRSICPNNTIAGPNYLH